MGKALIGWENLVQASGVTFFTTSAAAGLPGSNVATDQGAPSAAWQTAAGHCTAMAIVIGALPAAAIAAVGIFRTNQTAAATYTITLFSGGSGGTPVWVSSPTGPPNGYGQVVVPMSQGTPPSATVSGADTLEIAIFDPTNPDGFLNVPLVWIGPAWNPFYDITPASIPSRVEARSDEVSRGGSVYPNLFWDARTWDVALTVTDAEMFTQADNLDQKCRDDRNVLFIRDQTSANINYESILGILRPSAGFGFPGLNPATRSWRGLWTERI